MRKIENSEGSLYQTKNGTWVFAITIGYDGRGKQIRKTVSSVKKSECIRKRNELLKKLEQDASAQDGGMKLADWVDHFLDVVWRDRVGPNTLRNYRSLLGRHVVPAIGDYALDEIGAEEIRELETAMRKGGASTKQIVSARTVLSVCLEVAVKERRIPSNPSSLVLLPKVRKRQQEPLTVDEARKVLSTAFDEGDPLASLWAALLLTGVRANEMLGLERHRVDFTGNVLSFSWQIQRFKYEHTDSCSCLPDAKASACPYRTVHIPEWMESRHAVGALWWVRPKSAAGLRDLPMVDVLARVLHSHISTTPDNEHGLVWVNSRGNPWDSRAILDHWHQALDRAGVRRVRLHDTRHTVGSLLRAGGVPLEVIRDILGHAGVDTTLIYATMTAEMAAAAMGSLTQVLDLGTLGLNPVEEVVHQAQLG